jgi:NhaP-type Na+/H+ or K+/H+ antiporter
MGTRPGTSTSAHRVNPDVGGGFVVGVLLGVVAILLIDWLGRHAGDDDETGTD